MECCSNSDQTISVNGTISLVVILLVELCVLVSYLVILCFALNLEQFTGSNEHDDINGDAETGNHRADHSQCVHFIFDISKFKAFPSKTFGAYQSQRQVDVQELQDEPTEEEKLRVEA